MAVKEKSLYNYKWQQARAAFLAENPLCIRCSELGRVTAATIVDHITPHRGSMILFWRRSNWQPMCKHCHDSYKQRLEKSGNVAGCSPNGVPIDPNHHWNTGK